MGLRLTRADRSPTLLQSACCVSQRMPPPPSPLPPRDSCASVFVDGIALLCQVQSPNLYVAGYIWHHEIPDPAICIVIRDHAVLCRVIRATCYRADWFAQAKEEAQLFGVHEHQSAGQMNPCHRATQRPKWTAGLHPGHLRCWYFGIAIPTQEDKFLPTAHPARQGPALNLC